MSIKVYVYHDADHNDVLVFSSLKKAKKYGDEAWPNPENPEWQDHWEADGHGNYHRGEYQSIHLREIDSGAL